MSKAKEECLILTMKLGANYGGIIQAYALQSFIKKIGLKVRTSTPARPSIIRRHIGNLKRIVTNGYLLNTKEEYIVFQNTNKFIQSNIEKINFYNSHNKPNVNINAFKNVIVGSDQVWRAKYGKVEKYFAKDIPENINRISYAASFGIGKSSEYNTHTRIVTRKLIKKFKAISVREDSGIKLCKEIWGINAEQHIDPTLLIDKDEYIQLINADTNTLIQNNGIFAYILDRSNDKNIIIKKVEKTLNLKSFEIMPPVCNSKKEFKSNPDKFVLPPVTQWLKSFNDAEFIVTDSFHGCVFSIIFNKRFIAIGNKGRGLTRFTSLLKLFGLENRLVLNSNDLTEKLIKDKINWSKIQEIIEFEQKRSLDFLTKNLTDEAKNE